MTVKEYSSDESGGFKVLFVCTANICRSPMAEAIFNDLAGERGLNASATSAGVHASRGHDMAPNSRIVLQELGFSSGTHRSHPLTRELFDESSLILTMTKGHSAAVVEKFGPETPVMTLSEFADEKTASDVSDPYGMTIHAYRATIHRVLELIEASLDKIQRNTQ